MYFWFILFTANLSTENTISSHHFSEDFQVAAKFTFDYQINVKIALLFPNNYGVITQVHECSGQLYFKDLAISRKRTCLKHRISTNAKQFELTVNNQSRRCAFKQFFNLRQDGLRKFLCRN